MIGKTVSHYRVIDKLGQGGMGEVYLATDLSLDRRVALKFLPESLHEDGTAKQRFVLEAKSTAALDHPYICKVFEVAQTSEGQAFIVLEYVQGRTLEDELARSGSLPLKKAVALACEVAEALESAHGAGIVHRDLKPANIMITEQGHAKVMDFGLAKRITGTEATTAELTADLTVAGTTVGTLSYMSPEQLRGELLDARTDIFSFGIVLFEMLSGVHPFRRSAALQTANAILEEEPVPVEECLSACPALLSHILRKALSKQKERRYQLIHEVRTDLEDLLDWDSSRTGEARLPASRARGSGRSNSWVWIPAAAIVGAIGALLLSWGLWQGDPPSDAPTARYSVHVDAGKTLHFDPNQGSRSVAISPDGMSLAYTVREGDTTRIFLRRANEFSGQPLTGTEGGISPFFSADSSWLGFVSGTRLLKVSLQGGTPQTLAPVEAHVVGGDWDRDGTVIFSDCMMGLKRVSETGENLATISTPGWGSGGQEARNYGWPQLLPGSESVLLTVDQSPTDKRVAVYSLESGEVHEIIPSGTSARYLPTGHIAYAWQGDLFVIPFDPAQLRTTAAPVKVLEGVLMEDLHGVANFSVSDRGTLAYVPGTLVTVVGTLVLVDPEGNRESLPRPGGFRSPRLSPDGKHVLVSKMDEFSRTRFWVYEFERGSWRRLREEDEDGFWGVWGQDGSEVFYNSTRDRKLPMQIMKKSLNATSSQFLEVQPEGVGAMPSSVSPDGKSLFFVDIGDTTGIDIWVFDLSEQQAPRRLLGSSHNEVHPVLSPNQRWLAYASDESGTWEVYVSDYPGLTRKVQVSAGGAWEPLWAPGGGRLYFRDTNGRSVRTAAFEEATRLDVGTPELLFEGPYTEGMAYGRMYDLSADGSRFLMIEKDEEPLPTEIRMVQGWFEEVGRLAPPG